MEHLNLQLSVLDRDKLVEVTVMQNSSPCWGCSDRYEKDLGDIIRDSGITVTIVFSSFHRIRRRSCQWQHHLHVNTIPLEHHTLNRDGLKKMSKVGIILKTAQFQDWKVLRIALQLPDNIFEEAYNRSPRRKEDVLLKEDLDFILEN
nr:hypothetical protein BaRGS_003633 [Batillaria attramentaria]